ncbi:MAG TPA: sugar phosphate isomerase/epimerase family protein, partial [Pyrinomonadaceae bacterium]|nr:sugar phosphate isomerase/epimerase family protein [Pyrinomonadaceae bacterium]
ATDIRAASEAGFDCLEIWASKLRKYLGESDAAGLRKLFDQSGIEPYSINSIERITFRDSAGHARLLEECEELCRTAAAIRCPYIVVVPSPLPRGRSWDDTLEESVRVLRDLARVSAPYNVALAFEFLGQTGCSVQTLREAAEIVSRVGRENVGLVLDSFHFYAGNSTLESIAALDAQKLYVFHINDAEDLPREQLEDRHRLLPGLGILPLGEIITMLRRINYDRVTSVEIFRPEYWERDPFELAREARAATAVVLARG